jgi:iron complex outermembrane receptor protein
MSLTKYGVSTLALSVGLGLLAFGSVAAAQESSVSEVIITGTRTTGVKASDSAQPIEVVGAAALARVGQPDLMQALSQSLPSFNAQGYGSDTAALSLEAALRGLNPNETLVLVNGKRVHGTANLQVDGGSPYTGAAAPDLSFIPVGAIDHVEVLQDGAAAQYGSDAIAGVVNIILKKNSSGGVLSATGGQYMEGDGATGAWSVNKGFGLGDNGFVNVTLEERVHSFSRQGTYDARFNTPSGTFINQNAVDNNIPQTAGYPKMNNIYGDPEYHLYNFEYNAGYNLGDGIQLYSFGSYGHRTDSAFENYRKPSKVLGCTGTPADPGVLNGTTCSSGTLVVPFPTGFSPREKFTEDNYSFTGGIKGDTFGWHWDLSSTYGDDHDDVYTINSANAQEFADLQSINPTPIVAQRNFYDGTFDATEWTNNLDVSKPIDTHIFASPLTVAFGAETRRDTYSISAGEPSSYYGGVGAQSFAGYSPLDAGGHARTSYAGYVDLAAEVITHLHLDLAGRYEHYSDFGDTTVGKATARYDFTPAIAVRGTISTGFRAPTPQEEYYTGINVSPAFIQGQLAPNSAAAVAGDFSPLKPETSHNYSLGFVLHPAPKLQITLDAYEIDIANRIVGSGFLLATLGGVEVAPGPYAALSKLLGSEYTTPHTGIAATSSYTGVQLFTNGVNTHTDGAELTANYASDFGDFGHVDWSVGANYNHTMITHIAALPASSYNLSIGQTALLGPNATSSLTSATPKFKFVLAAFWRKDKWSVNLREDIYGPVSEWVSLDGSGASTGATDVRMGTSGITDLDIGYMLTSKIKLDVGANNLFDIKPVTIPNYNNGGHIQPADGNNVFGEPIGFSPFGINGGYYYGRLTYTF